MAHARHNDRRDGNDAELTRALRQLGCDVDHLGRDICDKLVLCPDGRFELAEIKDPTQRLRLTDNEKKTAAKLERRGRILWILQTVEDCAALVNNRPDLLTVNQHAPR